MIEGTPTTATELDRPIPFGRPIIGDAERTAVAEVLAGHVLTHGDRVRAFESSFADFTGAPHALAVGSCTAAMQLAWMAAGIGPGDEVLVAAQSHVATAHAVELTGARCVFVDSEPRTGNLDLDQLEARITERTRGLAIVHYLGFPVDMDRVMKLAQAHDLFVVEDAATALGSTWRGTHVGLHGDAGCFSFYPVKHITTGEGGMLITRRDDVAHEVGRRRAFGIDRSRPDERALPGTYDVETLGFNGRMGEMNAAIGVEQMRRLPDFLRRRERHQILLDQAFDELLGDHPHVRRPDWSEPRAGASWYCAQILLDGPLGAHRDDIVRGLKARQVGCSIYYPQAIPCMTHHRTVHGTGPGTAPIADRISRTSIALPVGPHLGDDDIVRLAHHVTEVIQSWTR